MNTSNKHLKSKMDEINNFISARNNPPKDMYDEFLLELKFSQLYIPAFHEDEGVTFEHLESPDGLTILQVFTTPDEYGGENELMNFGFDFYAEIIADCDFDGAVINPTSDEIFVPRVFTEKLRTQPGPNVDDDEIYDAYELKEVAHTAKNESLVAFIQDESNFNKFDGLIDVLGESVLLNVVSSRRDLTESARDGIVTALEVGGFNLSVRTEGQEKYAVLFTGIDKIRDTCDTGAGLYYYCQIASFDKLLDFILMNDLDGMIINPYLDDYYVPRNILLDIYENHPEIVHNPKYMGGTFFAFTF